jgi:hypothetical protein
MLDQQCCSIDILYMPQAAEHFMHWILIPARSAGSLRQRPKVENGYTRNPLFEMDLYLSVIVTGISTVSTGRRENLSGGG